MNKSDKKSDKENRTKKSDKKIEHEFGVRIRQINPTKNRTNYKIGQIKSDKENRTKKMGQKNYCLVGVKNCNGVGTGKQS